MIDGLVLAPDVHAVLADDRVVFLDVGKDRYFKLGIAHANLLAEKPSDRRSRLVGQLIKKGLAAASASSDGVPSDERSGPHPYRRRGVGVLEVAGACHWAANALRQRSLRDILAWARRTRAPAGNVQRNLVSRFLALRPFYPRDYNCLFDSLALSRFLRERRASGDWVFGVRGAPFAAHCWVEIEGVPVNDDPDFVAPYVPILRQ